MGAAAAFCGANQHPAGHALPKRVRFPYHVTSRCVVSSVCCMWRVRGARSWRRKLAEERQREDGHAFLDDAVGRFEARLGLAETALRRAEQVARALSRPPVCTLSRTYLIHLIL